MTSQEIASAALLVPGAFFFLAGTVGLLRFPDVYTRLHALTKADNLGLGFVALGLAVGSPTLPAIVELVMTWALVLVASSITTQLVARHALEHGVTPLRQP